MGNPLLLTFGSSSKKDEPEKKKIGRRAKKRQHEGNMTFLTQPGL